MDTWKFNDITIVGTWCATRSVRELGLLVELVQFAGRRARR